MKIRMYIFTAVAFLMLHFAGSNPHTALGQEDGATADRPQYIITVAHGTANLGAITIELFPDVAPLHVANFDSLVSIKFYDGLLFHRVIPDFMIQGGDPNTKDKPRNTWGMGDKSQTLVPAEFSEISHERGIISAARKGGDVNSATSQFFICHDDSDFLDGKYSVFGKVIAGMDIVDAICEVDCDEEDGNKPVVNVVMTSVRKL